MENNFFSIKWKDGALIYAPVSGYIFDIKSKSKYKVTNNSVAGFPAINKLDNGLQSWEFNPPCLTLYLGNKCNIDCSYCYIPEKQALPDIKFDPAILLDAAEIISNNCKALNKPFILGFHGGNEPLLHVELIQKCINICKESALTHDLKFFAYCTTNGIIPHKTAIWAARTFHGITLSWDGQDPFHNKFRQTLNGKGTAQNVKRTFAIFADPNYAVPFLKVRATITRESADKLLEMVQFFNGFKVKHLDLFPVYQNMGHCIPENMIPDKKVFVKNFLKAKKWGEQNEMLITYANTRLGDYHDKHCSIFQNNLTITPDGHITSCFQATHNHQDHHQKFMFGSYDESTQKLNLNEENLSSLYQLLTRYYPQCEACFNNFHCSKGCPDICPVSMKDIPDQSFDCTTEKWIGLANILKSSGYEIKDSEMEDFEDFFSSIEVNLMDVP